MSMNYLGRLKADICEIALDNMSEHEKIVSSRKEYDGFIAEAFELDFDFGDSIDAAVNVLVYDTFECAYKKGFDDALILLRDLFAPPYITRRRCLLWRYP